MRKISKLYEWYVYKNLRKDYRETPPHAETHGFIALCGLWWGREAYWDDCHDSPSSAPLSPPSPPLLRWPAPPRAPLPPTAGATTSSLPQRPAPAPPLRCSLRPPNPQPYLPELPSLHVVAALRYPSPSMPLPPEIIPSLCGFPWPLRVPSSLGGSHHPQPPLDDDLHKRMAKNQLPGPARRASPGSGFGEPADPPKQGLRVRIPPSERREFFFRASMRLVISRMESLMNPSIYFRLPFHF